MKVGFLGMLTIVFITLKLTEVITWSWIWVLSPIWVVSSIFGFAILVTFIILYYQQYKEKKNNKKGEK